MVFRRTRKGSKCVLDQKVLTEGRDIVWANLDPRFQAGLPFPVLGILLRNDLLGRFLAERFFTDFYF